MNMSFDFAVSVKLVTEFANQFGENTGITFYQAPLPGISIISRGVVDHIR